MSGENDQRWETPKLLTPGLEQRLYCSMVHMWLLVNGYCNIAHTHLGRMWTLLRILLFWKDFCQSPWAANDNP